MWLNIAQAFWKRMQRNGLRMLFTIDVLLYQKCDLAIKLFERFRQFLHSQIQMFPEPLASFISVALIKYIIYMMTYARLRIKVNYIVSG